MDDQQLGPTLAVPPVDDPELIRLRRHRRLLGAFVVAAAVAGLFAGAALERRSATDEAVETASDGTATVPTTQVDDPDRSMTSEAATSDDAGMVAGGGIAADSGHGYPFGPPLEWLGAGSTDGVDVRLLLADYGPQDDGNPFWEAPPGCHATGSYSIEVSSERFAAVVGMERFGWSGRPDGTVQLVGAPEGDPRWLVVAAVDPAGTTVVFPDGQSAPAIDISGLSVAAAPAPSWATVEQGEQGLTARVEASDGSTHEVTSWFYPSEEFLRENCVPPPPSLPDPGEQPGDPAAATDEVRAAITTVFGDPDPAAKSAVVEHPDVVIAAMEAVALNYQDITSTATMGDLVFTAPDAAFFYFDLDTSLGVRFDDQIGEARLVDGAWVITTESICVQLRRGGATCAPPA